VTGGAGFIGSHIVDELLEQGHEVVALDFLHPAAHNEKPSYLAAEAEWIWADVRDPDVVVAALHGCDHVCHQAAMVGLGTDLSDLPDYESHNGLGTAVLLSVLAVKRFTGRLVQASSMVVYGEGRYRCDTHGEVRPGPRRVEDLDAGRFEPPCPRCGADLRPSPVPEDARLDPRSVYAATKLHQEHLAAAFSRETGVAVTNLRYHNVYGPRMPRDTPYAGVASIFASSLAAGQAPAVFEDGGQLRDFIHVRDIARANVLALTAPDPVPGAFNVATGSPRSIADMAGALSAAHGPDAPQPRTTGQYRRGDVRHVFASADRAAEVLRFRASEDFAAGMREFASAALRS
jgi:dTDP-L-rhamnose 4-epimerase